MLLIGVVNNFFAPATKNVEFPPAGDCGLTGLDV
jgi:hypothetical protein